MPLDVVVEHVIESAFFVQHAVFFLQCTLHHRALNLILEEQELLYNKSQKQL